MEGVMRTHSRSRPFQVSPVTPENVNLMSPVGNKFKNFPTDTAFHSCGFTVIVSVLSCLVPFGRCRVSFTGLDT